MNKRHIVIIFDGIIHEYFKDREQLDSRSRPQIVRPRFTIILKKTLKIRSKQIVNL